jgi:Protein of unknown function (DUF742)
MSDHFDRGDHTMRVRPYALTGGRTRSAIDLPIETIVRSTLRGLSLASQLTLERKRIVTMCTVPLSIAEISAHMHVPLGVARVLVGDMNAEALLETNKIPVLKPGDRPDIKLLERVLDGLQAL